MEEAPLPGHARHVVLALVAIAVVGCQAPGPIPHATAPKPNLSTPELALKSYWERKDWYSAVYSRAWQDTGRAGFSRLATQPAQAYGAVATSEALRYRSQVISEMPADQLGRSVESVTMQGAALAIVVARIRNTEPIAAGAKPEPADVERRQSGELFRYVLALDGGAWKVVEIWSQENQGWRKREPSKRPPWYPHEVREDAPASIAAAGPAPKADLATPQSALRSYWNVRDWYEPLLTETYREISRASDARMPSVDDAYGEVMAGDALAYHRGSEWIPPPLVVAREIRELKHETASRAVIVVHLRNVAPIPEGARPSEWEVARRAAGALFRYVMLQDADGWKVAEIWRDEGFGWDSVTAPLAPAYPSYVYGD